MHKGEFEVMMHSMDQFNSEPCLVHQRTESLGSTCNTYSIGMPIRRLPEVIVSGWAEASGEKLIYDITQQMLGGKALKVGDYIHDANGTRLKVGSVHPTHFVRTLSGSSYFHFLHRLPAHRLRAVQLIWPSEDGLYPDDANAPEILKQSQPLYDQFDLLALSPIPGKPFH